MTCRYDDCEKPTMAKGACSMHYQREKYGRGLWSRYESPEQSFAARTRPTESGCIEWTGNLQSAGYGRISVYGKRMKAHRYAWERVNGPIPAGMLVDHMCWNRACVNVDHLRLATHSQNLQNLKGTRGKSRSGLRGVYWSERDGRWYVAASVLGKVHYGGWFRDKHDAGVAAAALRKELMTHAQN